MLPPLRNFRFTRLRPLLLVFVFVFIGCSSQVAVDREDIFDLAASEYTASELAELRSMYDSDQDGLSDDVDPCPASPFNDQDGDGYCEVVLSDIDQGGCVDETDKERLSAVYGETGKDLSEDLLPDGVINLADVAIFAMEFGTCEDNCPTTPNPTQEDADLDGTGDACTNILATCGNGTLDDVEACEGSDLGGRSCLSLGFESGTLSCTDRCELDTTGCSATFEIANIEGSFQQGSTMTISGEGFGSKTNAAPVVFDNMETGQFHPRWRDTPARVLTESRHRNSTFAGHHNFQGSGGDGGSGYFTGPSDTLGERWYVQYWFKMDLNFDWGFGRHDDNEGNLSNVKIFRMWNPGSIDENFVMATQGYGGGSVIYGSEYINGGNGAGYCCAFQEWPKGVWNLFQFEYKESDIGSFNGEIRLWLNGELKLEDRSIITREDFANLKRPFIVGFYDSWNDSYTDPDDWYIDDAYIDNTFARVEVGNAPVYSEATHREIQIPTAWTDGSITVQANTGSLVEGSAAYLFVIDHDGNVSPGYGPIPVQ